MSAPIVVFELNEVPWRILDWWAADHPESAIAQTLASSEQWTTVAADEGHLSPWITWPTVHRGVPNTVHGIGHFGQDTTHVDETHPTWFSHAAAHGVRTGVFGLLHTSTLPTAVWPYDFWVPDTFAPTPDTHPKSLEAFQAFNLGMARASARNVSTGIDKKSAAAFVAKAPLLGLKPRTVATLLKQLVDERSTPEHRVRRRSLQAVLAFDLFAGQLTKTKPQAAAFFTNHVAAAMHRYWAATFPGDYDADTFGFEDEWISRWNGEIGDALAHADRMVARLRTHADRTGGTLVVLSSMGQQAAEGTPVGKQLYLRDLDRFFTSGGITAAAWTRRPAMDPQVNVFVDADHRAAVESYLATVSIGGQLLDWDHEDGLYSLTLGQADDAIGEITIGGAVVDPAAAGFEIIEIEDEVASTGYHIPEGSLWAYTPARRPTDKSRPSVPTTAIAPAILEALGLARLPHHDAGTLQLR